MKALFLGSISVLADTSEMQRCAFNQAFNEAGLTWYWSATQYRDMLGTSGGQDRITAFAQEIGADVDAKALHQHKTAIFQDALRAGGLELRCLTAHLLEDAHAAGLHVAVVSGTAKDSLDALINGLGGADALGLSMVTSADEGLAAKPSPALYQHALARMRLHPADVVAVEDNVPGMQAAQAAGLSCYVYPNDNTALHDFGASPHLRELTLSKAA